MKKRWIHIIVLILALLLLSQFDISEYLASIKELSISTWMILVLLQMLTFFLLLIQWKRISDVLGKKVTIRDMISVNMRGTFYETITPGLKVGGELAKGLTLVSEMGFSPAQASALVIIQKSISIFAMVLLSIISFVFISFEVKIAKSILIVISISMLALLILLFVVLFVPEKLYKYFLKLKSEKKAISKAKDFLEKYIQALNEIKKDKREVFSQLLLSLFIWVLFPFKLYFIVKSLGLDITFLNAFAVTIVSYIAGMVPLLPGGLGSFEGTMVGLFLIWGINKEQGLVIATLFRFTTFWLIFFASVVYLGIKKFSYRLKGA